MTVEFTVAAARCRALARSPLTRAYAKRAFTRLLASMDPPPIIDGEVAGLPVRLDLSQGWDRKIFLHGLGDSRAVLAMVRIMKALDCRTAWDVGANRGNHSAAMVPHCRCLFAFEPDPNQQPRLAALLAGAPTATAVAMGLSDQPGELPFRVHRPGQSATFEAREGPPDAVAPVCSGDVFARENGVTDLDFVKIDVEGHEPRVLRGMADILRTQRPVIVVEVLASQAAGRPSGWLGELLPDYALFGNYQGLASRISMSACHFGPFREGRTYTHALAVPVEKLGRLAGIVPAGVIAGARGRQPIRPSSGPG